MSAIAEKWRRMVTFLSEPRAELKKVTFPSRSEVISTTIVVIVTSVIFAFFLWIADQVITRAYQGVFNLLGS